MLSRKKERRLSAPLLRPQGWGEPLQPRLWNVVAQRRKDHVVVGLWTDGETAGGYAACARPGILGEVRVLHAELHATLRASVAASVEPVPETDGAFLDDSDVSGAIRAAGRIEVIDRHAFRGATAVIGCEVSVPADTVQRERGRGCCRNRRRAQWIGGRRRGRRNGRGLGDGHCVISLVAGAPGILCAVIAVQHELWTDVPFDSCQTMAGPD